MFKNFQKAPEVANIYKYVIKSASAKMYKKNSHPNY